jgi:hypothetical protein
MADNVVDLSKEFALDVRAKGFLSALRSLAAVSQPLGDVMATMMRDEQRVLAQVIAWRLEGGALLPATASLIHLPLLTGMGLNQLQEIIETLVNANVLEQVTVSRDKAGEPTQIGWRWPALERLLLQGEEIAKGPQLTTPGGAPLRK